MSYMFGIIRIASLAAIYGKVPDTGVLPVVAWAAFAAGPATAGVRHVPEPLACDPEDKLPLPKAPRYDDEGFCLTPAGRNRRPCTYDSSQLE